MKTDQESRERGQNLPMSEKNERKLQNPQTLDNVSIMNNLLPVYLTSQKKNINYHSSLKR